MRLGPYLDRIGIRPPLTADAVTLRRVHAAHRHAFLFENLSIQAGGAVSVALPDIERKFLDEGRGGYCFEHNTLFAAALGDIGFSPTVLLGRVRRGPPEQWARTHMVLRLPVDEGVWLADVGFGALSLLEPMPLEDNATARQLGLVYTLRRERDLWVLSIQEPSGPLDLYEFTEDPQTPGDVEVANHYTATHPASVFRQTLTIQRVTAGERLSLRGETLVRYRDGRTIEERIDRARLFEVARELFGV